MKVNRNSDKAVTLGVLHTHTHTHTHTGTPSGYLRYAKIGYRSKLKTHVF